MHMPVAKAKQLKSRSDTVAYTSDMNTMMDEVSCVWVWMSMDESMSMDARLP